jgi:uncharacterized protein (DUF1499 family)
MLLWVVLAAVIALLAFIRFAPSEVTRWHVVTEASADKSFASGVMRVVNTGPDGLIRLNAIALATPRTKTLAGSVDEGMVTYVTRSLVFGFPDYTTVQQVGDSLIIYARLRFGRSDTGVNGARIEIWIDALQP